MCRGIFSAVEPDMSSRGLLSTFGFKIFILISCALSLKHARVVTGSDKRSAEEMFNSDRKAKGFIGFELLGGDEFFDAKFMRIWLKVLSHRDAITTRFM